MRKWLRYSVLLLVVLLLAAGLYGCLRKDDGYSMESSSTGLGLMLLEKDESLYVLAVTKGSPAEKAGVLPGDYLIQADDIRLHHPDQLNEAIPANAGEMQLQLMRDGEEIIVRLTTK